ncbi:hypothetical protein [Chroococcidiopsis sp.]|uniref:hypothetical protein n=1 Tax=Chroococcidiopsis sp. TaxID=3088168 RepID=UPI003F3B339E
MPRKPQKIERLKCTSIEQILSCCNKLTLAQLKLIKEAIEIMIARLEDKQLEPSGGRGRSELSSDFSRPYRFDRKIEKVGVGVRGSTGYIESKFIRGHGPYLYLRMRRDGVHHSFYLGKDEQ